MSALAGLALAAVLAAPGAGGGAVVALRAASLSRPLDLSLVLAPESAEAPPPALSLRQDGEGLVGEVKDALREVEVRLSPRGDGFALAVRVRYLADVLAEREAVRLRLKGPVQAVAQDLGWRRVGKALRVERGTPIVVVAEDLAVVGGPGLAAARVARRPDGGADLDLILDDEASHPFSVYEHCLPRLPEDEDGNVPFAALEHKRSESRMPRHRGDEVRGGATLYLLGGAQGLPLVPERWPAGTRAAVVFTDHADRTDPEALRALLYGDSRPFSRPEGPGGFLGRGLRITKSFFVHARRGALDDPETAALARELRSAGSEVASHSPTPVADDRDAVRSALGVLRRFGATTWIDHEPYTNCEAISAEGWRAGGPYAVTDLLAEAGFRWVWEAGDVGGFAREPAIGNLFAPGLAPAFYPLPVDSKLWVFGSTMFHGTPEALGRALSDAALDRLEAERGLFVAHTYLAAAPRTTTRPELLARLVVREVPGGLELDPAFDEALGRLARRARAGTIASLTWDEAGTRLRALEEVEVTYRSDGAAEVSNRGKAPLLGLTVAIPAPDLELEVEGAEASEGEHGPSSRVWFDLPAGASVVVRASRGGAPFPLLPVASPTLATLASSP